MAMDKRRNALRYRPGIAGFGLEERVVLSDTGTQASLWGMRHFFIGDDLDFLKRQYQLPDRTLNVTVLNNVNTEVRAGFKDLIASVVGSSDAYLAALNAPDARATFDAEVHGALTALTAQLTSQLAFFGPSARPVRAEVQQLILGTGPTSLATLLAEVPTPASGTDADATAFNLKLTNAIASTREQVIARTTNYLNIHHLSTRTFETAVAPGHAVTRHSVMNQTLAYVQTAFAGLANDYALGAGPWLADAGTIETGRAAFDLNTQSALNSLTATISSTLLLNPNTAGSLVPLVQERLLGEGGLLATLDALPNPTDNAASGSSFGQSAASAIASTYNQVATSYRRFARGKPIATITPTTTNNGFGGGFGGFGFGYIPWGDGTDVQLDYVPTFLNDQGFDNTLLGLGENAPRFAFGTEPYGQDNGLPADTGFNAGFNAGFTQASGLNYKSVKPIGRGPF